MCEAITRFGRPATGESLTTYQFIEKAFKVAGLKTQQADVDRFEALEANIQLAVSGIDTSAFFKAQKVRPLPMKSLSQIIAERDLEIHQLTQRVTDLQNSASWKVTAPVRAISQKIKSLLA
jgi:hypothetical protein